MGDALSWAVGDVLPQHSRSAKTCTGLEKSEAPRCACHVGKLGELTYSACEAAALSCPGVPCFVLLLPCLYRTFLTELRISSLEGRLVYLG